MAACFGELINVSARGATVALTGGNLPKGLTFKDGVISGTPTEPGDSLLTFSSTDENGAVADIRPVTLRIIDAANAAKPAPKSSFALTDEQRRRCIVTGLGLGLPLLALVPIALASQVAIPGLPPVFQEVSARIQDANKALHQSWVFSNRSSLARSLTSTLS